jgi:alpha-tubulin suppressor-like RCC1 family protein
MPTTNFKNSSGTDIGNTLVEKSYLIDRYPELADTFKQAGLFMWGYNNVGQLGDNSQTNTSTPVQTVASGTNWKLIECSCYHTAAIKTDGTLWTWGQNNLGQLGLGDLSNRSSPTQVGSATTWKLVSGGSTSYGNYGKSFLAIKTDGTLWGWGDNSHGLLALTAEVYSTPTQVGSDTTWKQVSVGGSGFSMAIKTNGTLWGWGRNNRGQLGVGDTTDRGTPVQVGTETNWKQISSGNNHAASIKTDGSLWLWGRNDFGGALGDGTRTDRNSPVQTVSGGYNWKLVSAGGYNTSAIKTDGTMWAWGYNDQGGVGDGTRIDKSSPVQTISGGTNWKSVFYRHPRYSAMKTDGTLWIWGYNTHGEIGNGFVGDNSAEGPQRANPTPTQVPGTNWKSYSVGRFHSAGIKDDSADIFGNSL